MFESTVEREISGLIQKHGRITFAQYMQTCLYSPNGGFYSSRGDGITAHFSTSATIHPAFGALIARQLEEMWHLLEQPPVFHVIEVGCGDGALARSIVDAGQREHPEFARALRYVATDYQPGDRDDPTDSTHDVGGYGIRRVRSAGLQAFGNVTGCILSNELIDNFPVHRFVIQSGEVREVFVASVGGELGEVVDAPSTPRIAQRLTGLGLSLPEGYRGEVNLAIEDWYDQIAGALERGFVLTIDYGQLAAELYSPRNAEGTLVCYNRHVAGNDPYRGIGQQDITCHVDFTSLMRLGEERGLATVGHSRQSEFLANLGFRSFLDAVDTQGLSAARAELSRIAMMTLVDPDEYGDFKVLVQSTGDLPDLKLLGFEGTGTQHQVDRSTNQRAGIRPSERVG